MQQSRQVLIFNTALVSPSATVVPPAIVNFETPSSMVSSETSTKLATAFAMLAYVISRSINYPSKQWSVAVFLSIIDCNRIKRQLVTLYFLIKKYKLYITD